MGTHIRWALVVGALVTGCSDNLVPRFDNPADPINGQGLPVPVGIIVRVGSNRVELQWELPGNETADEFSVYRRRLDASEAEMALGRVSTPVFVDAGVRNGRTYAYRVAVVRDGRSGPRSEAVEARPGVFSIVIADDAPKTRSRSVTVTPVAAAGEAMRLAESLDSLDNASWRRLAASLSLMLSAGDGAKTLHCTFRLLDGSETLAVSDAIVLDSRAAIDSVGFEGNSTRHPGETVHFFLHSGETGGTATVEVAGLFTSLTLFDDGRTGGDRTPGDGMYERDAVLPPGRLVTAATVTGNFTDDVGNTASGTGSGTLTVRECPPAISILEPPLLAVPPDPTAVTLGWTQAQASDFSAYRIYRAETMPVDSTSKLAGTVTAARTTEFTDSNVIEGREYFYRVFVLTTSGLQCASTNVVQVAVPNLRPPQPVILERAEAIGARSLSLRWNKSTDRDFGAYKVYRNESGAVSDADSLICTITRIDEPFCDDRGLVDNTTYFYRVYTLDTGGLQARSNPVEAKTTNEAPPAVVLHEATDIDSTAATLSWERSEAHDFASYHVYRDTIPTVTTASELIVEVDERQVTSYRVTELESGTLYYFRIYVVDNGTLSMGSPNTVSVRTTSG